MKNFRTRLALYLYPGDLYIDCRVEREDLEYAQAKLDAEYDKFRIESTEFNQKMVSQSNQCERECKLAIKRKKECNALKRELRKLHTKLSAKILVYGELEGEAVNLADAAEEFLMGGEEDV
jgi:hypothetical protein